MNVLTIAAGQGGVITRRQALEAGLSERQIDRRVASGRWQAVVAGVYRLIPAVGRDDHLKAAIAGLPDALASHGTAARLLGLAQTDQARPSVLVAASTTHQFPGVEVRRTTVLDSADRATVDGLPVTSAHRTVFDLAADLVEVSWRQVADDLVVGGRIAPAQVAAVYERAGGRGRPGSRTVRLWLQDRETGPAHSRLEAKGLRILTTAGFRGFEVQYPIPWAPGRRFDLAFPAQQVAVEWDSRRWHTARERMAEDRRRDREAVANGWVPVRFVSEDVDRPAQLTGELQSILSARTPLGSHPPFR